MHILNKTIVFSILSIFLLNTLSSCNGSGGNSDSAKMAEMICEMGGIEKEYEETNDESKKSELDKKVEEMDKKLEAFDKEVENKFKEKNDKKGFIQYKIDTLKELVASCDNASSEKKKDWEEGIKKLEQQLAEIN